MLQITMLPKKIMLNKLTQNNKNSFNRFLGLKIGVLIPKRNFIKSYYFSIL